VVAGHRTDRLRAKLAAEHVDAVALTSVPNIAYCTGFLGVFDDEPAHVAVVGAAGAVLYTDSRYFDALTTAAKGSEWQVRLVKESLTEIVARELDEAGATSVALETSQPYDRYQAFATALAATVVPASGWVEELRAVKDAGEIASHEAAQALTDRAFDHILGTLRPGVAEARIALDLEYFMRSEGSEGVAFAPIIASGPNSALPHATPGSRELQQGDFVVLDFGARLGGYRADMTRTVVIGSASERHREIYSAVLAANAAGTEAVRAGLTGREIDAAARAVIAERGFAEHFGHGLGHGVGLEIHEQPGVGPRSEGVVPLGAVITIEPGIYIPGFGGVRIEDLVVVEEAGARVLTRSPKELLEL
jgi:Xaa-Pro aminopeptidase